MSSFNIPERQATKQSLPKIVTQHQIDYTTGDDKILLGMDQTLSSVVQHQICKINENSYNQVISIIDTNRREKAYMVKIIVQVYNTLRKQLEETLKSNKKEFITEVIGEYTNKYDKPSLDFWVACNKYHMIAIKTLFNELKEKGWNPNITGITEYTLDSSCVYSGGSAIKIFCSFEPQLILHDEDEKFNY